MDVRIFLGALAAAIVLQGVGILRATRMGKGRAKFELKKDVNTWRWPVHLIGAFYFLIGGVLQLPHVDTWSTAQIVAHPEYGPSTLTYYVYAAAPLIATIAILAGAVWFVAKGGQAWWKYSEQESEWLKEEQVRFRETLRKYLGKGAAKLVK